jgi:hypothetical protein
VHRIVECLTVPLTSDTVLMVRLIGPLEYMYIKCVIKHCKCDFYLYWLINIIKTVTGIRNHSAHYSQNGVNFSNLINVSCQSKDDLGSVIPSKITSFRTTQRSYNVPRLVECLTVPLTSDIVLMVRLIGPLEYMYIKFVIKHCKCHFYQY